MHTYGLPVVVSNTTNNYGPWQFPEKLIPLIMLNALDGEPLPVYGDGANQRDWLYVDDHAEALLGVLKRGVPGATYAIGARQPRRNIDVVRGICAVLDECCPTRRPARAADQLRDRPAGPRFPLRDRCQLAAARWAGMRRMISSGAAAHDRLVSGQPRLVGGDPRQAYAGQRLGTAQRKRPRGHCHPHPLRLPMARRDAVTRTTWASSADRPGRSDEHERHRSGRRVGHQAASGDPRPPPSSCCRSTTSR